MTVAFNRQKACRHGEMLYNIHDLRVGRSLDVYGEYLEGEIDLFRQVIQPQSLVVEVGANIGAHTVFLARQVTPNGRVIAFEPQRILFQTLCANLALNSIANVYCFQHALGARAGSTVVPPLDSMRAAYADVPAFGGLDSGEQVPLGRLDDLNLPFCHFLKVDVGGAEKEVLEGAAGVIERFKPVLYVANNKAHKAAELVRHIEALDYRMFWHRPPLFNPENFFGNRHNVFPNALSLMMVCIHQGVGLNMQGLEPVETPPKWPAAP